MKHTREVFLDTETTGLHPENGHRIIEIGAMEAINGELTGNNFHYYLNPGRPVDEGAFKIHGISNEFLADKLQFEDIHNRFISYIGDSTLVIHNAPFDAGFINNELKIYSTDENLKKLTGWVVSPFKLSEFVNDIVDTLAIARQRFPYPAKNNLDALCERFEVDNSDRTLHGAMIDVHLLYQVYQKMCKPNYNVVEELSNA